ncbi:excinuclease ABC subunit A [Acidaminobacter sp. JC074]|uniref:excinuclease ABC subunit UvrA n=1 Tax=Acidaminobacter sp. JC074 TaxID=2530199 RepID=UPI001F0F2390|nr:excinuclease ABC subunit UvrA [Acidaminobacter sp. JC074]MCH4890016.1 excinuclease ABC subunit A [Acidaminobacter sp. JC074]
MHNYIEVIGAREHNLKNVSVKIPKNKLVAITGPSGSGKSSFAMDILQKECQRQYMESMGLVTDGLNKPKVDKIIGLSPAIGISQRGIGSSSKSNVGTYTEILTYLRVLYSKIGQRTCQHCQTLIKPDYMNRSLAEIDEKNVVCPSCTHEMKHLTMGMFSFNKPEGACMTCGGLGSVTDIDLSKVVDESLTVGEGAVKIWGNGQFFDYYAEVLEKCGQHYGFKFDASKKVKDYNDLERLVFYKGVDSEAFKALYPNIKKPKKVHEGYFKGILTFMNEKAKENATKEKKNSKIKDAFISKTCPECEGSRLSYEGRTVRVQGKTLVEVSSYDLKELISWLDSFQLTQAEEAIASAVVSDLKKRIKNVIKIGLGYLSLDRQTSTLSGGEAQRLKLSNIIDSGLTGVLYVLDEPTTGLHPHDGNKLLDALKHIRDLGNTVLVIEHDTDFIGACDHIIDFGPNAGPDGGRIVFSGRPEEIIKSDHSVTGKYMTKKVVKPNTSFSVKNKIGVKNAYAHNLQNISLDIPLNALVCFTGVSGSGKSSLVIDIIDKYVKKGYSDCETIHGIEYINRIVTINQKPIGRMSRSNVATYTEVFSLIRELFSSQKDARKAKLKSTFFSFNVKGGRCEHCSGLGVVKLDMHFLDDVEVQCPVCEGHRFREEILRVKYKDKSISDVLDMTVDECVDLFSETYTIKDKLLLLSEVGLGYLKLGQTTITLSGGECQRIKLAKELSKESVTKTLYILDEPTTGLHPRDIEKITTLLRKLKNKGNSIFVIEHALEVMAASDYIIDLGPYGGREGGQLVGQGSVMEIISQKTLTGLYLKNFIKEA